MAEIKTIQVQGRGVESFADDLVTGRGVVLSRAATILRSVETKPTIGRFENFYFFPFSFAEGFLICLGDLIFVVYIHCIESIHRGKYIYIELGRVFHSA